MEGGHWLRDKGEALSAGLSSGGMAISRHALFQRVHIDWSMAKRRLPCGVACFDCRLRRDHRSRLVLWKEAGGVPDFRGDW